MNQIISSFSKSIYLKFKNGLVVLLVLILSMSSKHELYAIENVIVQTGLSNWLLTPNGGEVYTIGGTIAVAVDQAVFAPPTVVVELFSGSTRVWGPSYAGFTRTIPTTTLVAGSNYRVHVYNASNPTQEDWSNGTFSLVGAPPPLDLSNWLMTPNGGESIRLGCDVLVNINQSLLLPGTLAVELFNGATKVWGPSYGGSSYSRTLPTVGLTPGANYKIRVFNAQDPSQEDWSNSTFSIINENASTTLSSWLTTANGGETYTIGSEIPISINQTLLAPSTLTVELYSHCNKVWGPNSGGLTRTIPTAALNPGTNYRVRIFNASNPTQEDWSNAAFSLTGASQNPLSNWLTTPNGGQTYSIGNEIDVNINQSILAPQSLGIELFNGSVKVWGPVEGGIAGRKIQTASLSTGINYRVRVFNMLNPSQEDWSNAEFSLSYAGSVCLPPLVTNGLGCNAGSQVVLRANTAEGGGQTLCGKSVTHKWYTSETGNTTVPHVIEQTGTCAAYYTSVTVNSNVVYWVSSIVEGCESARSMVTANFDFTIPTAFVSPSLDFSNEKYSGAVYCALDGSLSTSFTASGGSSGSIFKWYDSQTSTNELATGAVFTTPTVTIDQTVDGVKTYFLGGELRNSIGCSFPITPRKVVSVKLLPYNNNYTAGVSKELFSDDQPIQLAPSDGGSIWQSSPNNVAIADFKFLPAIAGVGLHYISLSYRWSYPNTDIQCVSPTTSSTYTVYGGPVIDILGDQFFVKGTTSTLRVSGDVYTSIQWSDENGLITSATNYTIGVDKPGVYSVTVTKGGASKTVSKELKAAVDSQHGLNYRITQIPQKAITKSQIVEQSPVQDVTEVVEYFDGLGRLTQSVQTQASPLKSDIVQPVSYDALNRQSKKYLPYAATGLGDGRYKTNAIGTHSSLPTEEERYNSSAQYQYYQNADNVPHDIKPFSETIFEPSPLNRVIKQGAPGLAWQPNGDHTYNASDRTVKFSYEFNQANEVLQWTFTYPTEEYTTTALNAFGKVEAGTATAPVFYPANQLYKNKTKDEQGNQVIEYVDKEGRTVLKRVQVVTGNPSTTDTNRDTNWASTYYIYDDFGNLVCVIPPEPSKRLTTQYFQAGSTETTKNNFLKRWAFRYRYDGRKRMIMKQVPGAEPVYMVYDDRDRLVMTQDGNQRSGARWLFTKYDQLNRPIATGIKDTSAALTQSQMQAVVNTYYNDLATTKPWRKFGESYLGEGEPNTVHGYTNLSYPQTTTSSLNSPEHYVTVTYYDRYDFKSTWGGEYDYLNRELSATVNGVLYNQPQQASNRVIGQVTGSKAKVLDGEFNGAISTGVRGSYSWIRTINYYDDKYRLIQNIQENYKGGTDRMSSLYDFSGKILRSENIHETYDLKWGKLTKTFLLGNKLCSTADFTTQWGVSGTYSADVLPASTNGWLQWKAFQTYGGIVIGLSDQEVDVNYASIDYGIYMVGGAVLRVYESGVIKYSQVNGFKIGDVLRIERNGSTITYLKNGVVFYTSTVPSTSQLLTDVAYLAPNILAYDIKSSFSYRKQTTSRSFDYDHAGRLINTWHKFNDQPEILLAHNDYNELGQLIDKKLHSTVADASNAKQSVDYSYNIRGWLTHINDAALTLQAGESKDYFGMELAYNTDLGTGNPSDKLQFNGNINAMKWSNNQGLGDQKENAYNFTYDPLNRLRTADFRQKDAGSWGLAKHRDANGMMQSVDAFNESIMNGSLSGYDLNGNIQFLKRTGQNGQLIDNLVYSQGASAGDQSNKLMRVTDSANDGEGFKETNSGIDDYGYDSNGNLSYDHNKSTAELIKNGTFDSGQTEWTTTEPSRFSFVNGRVYVSAGTNTGVLTQAVAFRVGDPTFHVITINLVRTSTAGGVNVWIGNRTANSTPITVTATMQRSYAGGEQVVKLEILPEFEGYIEDISFKASTQVTYNYINLPAIVYRGNEGSIRYIYTATGQKLAQVVTEGTKTKTTDYVGEYVYENDTLLFVNHEEGRISLSSTSPLSSGGQGGEASAEYQYHLKDHLGNVRLTFTTKEETEATLATLETTNENEERGNFLKYDDIRKVNSRLFDHTHAPGVGSTHYAMRLSGTPQETYGLARSIAVMPGDVISAEVFAKYVDLNDPNVETFLENLAASIAAGTTSPGVVIDGGNFGTPAALTMPFGTILNKSSEAAGTPKAYLNWIVFDKNFRAILSKSGYRRVTTAASENGSLDPTNGLAAEGFPHERLFTPTIEVTEPGYVYIYLSNEEAGTEVYFDDFKVTHTKSPVIQSDDYYPFGLTFNSYHRENSTKNRYLYNQGTGDKVFDTERITDLELNVDMSRDRTYDYLTGRWWQVDPKADKEGQESWSTYQYGFDNPVRFNDPYGDCIPCIAQVFSAKYSALNASMKSSSSQGAVNRLMTNSSSTTQQRAGSSSPTTPVDNKAMAKIGDAKIVTGVTAKNTKTVTNEVSKDGLGIIQAVGTAIEIGGMGTPVSGVGAAINSTAGLIDEARQVAFEEKSVADALIDTGVGLAVDKTFSTLGDAAKTTVGGAEKKAHDKTVSAYEFSFTNLFQWVADKITDNTQEKNKK
ncbi:MAG: hypothetical protein EBR30_07860 [Cytophagia bacterium]|nr:hypothetical protein [Cytophagia bacterium]